MAKSGLKVVLVMSFILYLAMFMGILMVTPLMESFFKVLIISIMLAGAGVFVTYKLLIKYAGIEIKEEKIRKRDIVTEEFKEIYYKLFGEKITVNYFKSKKDFSAGKLVVIIFLGMNAIIALLVILEDIIWAYEEFIEFGMLIIASIIAIVCHIYFSKYKIPEKIEDYKNKIIAPFISMTEPNLKYYGDNVNFDKMKQEYLNADFDAINIHKMTCDDFILGKLDNGNIINLCDIHTTHITTVYRDGKMREVEEGLFTGMFGYIETDKYVSDLIRICINNKFNHLKESKIDIGSIEFEKRFDVFANNKVEAMSIINADLIASIVEFYENYDLDFEINFKDNKIYFRFLTYEMFESERLLGENKQRAFNYYYSILKFIYEFANKASKMHDSNEI